jgi:DNA-directed RNA polymerase specialized sigma24 family protein
MSGWPTPDEEAELLANLLAHSSAAVGELLGAFIPPLAAWLAAVHPRADEQMRDDAALDALASLVKRPESYKPERGKSLGDFLKMSASGDLKNLLAKERRRAARENSGTDVELLADRGNDIGTELEQRDEAERLEATVLAIVKDGLTPEELAGLELLVDGAKKTEAFIPGLKLEYLPPAERTEAVKRFKDKIKMRIKRAREVRDEST